LFLDFSVSPFSCIFKHHITTLLIFWRQLLLHRILFWILHIAAKMAPLAKLSLPDARPYPYVFPPATTALLIIDMQRDFVDKNGFGSIQCGNDEIHSAVRTIVPTIQKVLEVSRRLGMTIIHTREGHRPDLSDLPPSKKLRQVSNPNGHHTMGIGDQGPMGRLLVRGEWGHDIIDELRQLPGEIVIDKPGKGSYWGTGLHRDLLARGITHILIAGVTTE
jgi:nicotinamidase-related amidase